MAPSATGPDAAPSATTATLDTKTAATRVRSNLCIIPLPRVKFVEQRSNWVICRPSQRIFAFTLLTKYYLHTLTGLSALVSSPCRRYLTSLGKLISQPARDRAGLNGEASVRAAQPGHPWPRDDRGPFPRPWRRSRRHRPTIARHL